MSTISGYNKSGEHSMNVSTDTIVVYNYNDIINTLKQETLNTLQLKHPDTYFHPERDYGISWEILKKYPEIYNIYLSYITPKYTISKEAREMTKKGLSPTSEEAKTINNGTAELPNMDFFRKHGKGVNAVGATASALAPGAGLAPTTEAVQFSRVAASTVPMIPASALLAALTSCDPNDGPLGPKEIDKNDAPKLESSEKNVEAEKGATLSFDGLNLKLGNTVIAEFSDDYSKVLTATITINGNSVTLPYTLNETGVFNWSLTVKDSGNGTATSKTTSASGTITVKEVTPPNENQAPIISPEKYSDGATIKVGGGFRFFHEGNSFSIESQGKTEKCFSYSDRETPTENLKPTFTIDGQPIEYGKWYTEGNTVECEIEDDGTIENQDEKSEAKTDTITYTLNNEILDNDVLSGLDKLNSLQLKVGEKKEDLLNGIVGINGWHISKVEIEQNGQKTEISSTNGKYNYTPTQEGNVFIIVTGATEAGVTYEVKSNQIEVKENVKEYNAVIPAKAESMYQKFETTNDRAFERRGAYETKALAQSLKNRNACNVLIFKEGVYTGDNSIYERIGGNGDGHGEEVYRNIEKGSGTTKNILATKGTRIDVENNINSSSLKGQPIIITTSKETLGQETLNELLNNPKYKSFKNLGNDPDILIFAASCNTSQGRNYALHESITNTSNFPNGLYAQESATDTNNGIIAVEHGISNNISKHGVYEGNHKTTSCAFISKDNYIIPRSTISLPKNKTRNDSEERTVNNTSFAAPAAAAMARNVYDICHPLGIVKNLQEVRFLMEKYATPVPATREDIAPDGTIIEDVPNGYVYTMNLLDLIDNEVFPAIEKKCTSVNGECTILYTPPNGLQLAYQGAGVEYQDDEGNWIDTNGINPEKYVNKPQRINHALRSKTYKNKGGITIYCMVPDGVLDYGNKEGGYIVKKDNADIPTN